MSKVLDLIHINPDIYETQEFCHTGFRDEDGNQEGRWETFYCLSASDSGYQYTLCCETREYATGMLEDALGGPATVRVLWDRRAIYGGTAHREVDLMDEEEKRRYGY